MKKYLLDALRNSSFLNNIGILFAANLVVHALAFLNLILTVKVLTIEEVGVYQTFIAYTSIITLFVIFSFHTIVQTAKDEELSAYAKMALLVIVFFSLLSFLILKTIHYEFSIEAVLLSALGGLILLIDGLLIREELIKKLAFRKILASGLHTALLVLGLLEILKLDAEIVIRVMVVFYLVVSGMYFDHVIKLCVQKCSFRKMWQIVRKRVKSITSLSVSELLNIGALNLPIIIIERSFGAQAAAFYGIIMRICSIPITILGDAVAKIYLSSLGKEFSIKKSISLTAYKKLRMVMLSTGFAIVIGILILIKPAITLVLGSEWQDAAKMAQILSTMFAWNYILLPLSMVIYAARMEHLVLKMQGVYFIASTVGILVGAYLNNLLLGLAAISVLTFIRGGYYLFKIDSVAKSASNATQ